MPYLTEVPNSDPKRWIITGPPAGFRRRHLRELLREVRDVARRGRLWKVWYQRQPDGTWQRQPDVEVPECDPEEVELRVPEDPVELPPRLVVEEDAGKAICIARSRASAESRVQGDLDRHFPGRRVEA